MAVRGTASARGRRRDRTRPTGRLVRRLSSLDTLVPRRVLPARRPAAALLVVLSGAWLLVNHPVEGATLLVVDPSHGLTTSDLLSGAGVLWALAAVLWDRRA